MVAAQAATNEREGGTMATQLQAIYRDEKRVKDYHAGFRAAMRAAAQFVDQFDGQTLRYRLSDLLLMKFNQTKRQHARKTRKAARGER